jgi:hypothetical protein
MHGQFQKVKLRREIWSVECMDQREGNPRNGIDQNADCQHLKRARAGIGEGIAQPDPKAIVGEGDQNRYYGSKD